MIRTASYSRTTTMADPPFGSLPDQFGRCREWARIRDWKVIGEFEDRVGSGALLSRPGLQELLDRAHKGQFNAVVCESLVRLSHDDLQIISVFVLLRELHVRLYTVREGEITAKSFESAGRWPGFI